MKALLPPFFANLKLWRPAFADYRTYRRAVGFALAFLVCLGRRTISRAIWAQGRQFLSWASDYRLFSTSCWEPSSLFDGILERVFALMRQGQPLVAVMDDTIFRKTGKKIPQAKHLRDPLSPPFHMNMVWALRYLHMALLIWPSRANAAARAIPIAFELAPSVAKPKPPKKKNFAKCASPTNEFKRAMRKYKKDMKACRQRQRTEGLSAQGAKMIRQLRSRIDGRFPAWLHKLLWVVVDASFCNSTVLPNLPERTVLIGRTRKDIALYSPIQDDKKGKGRKRKYGDPLPTPEELRKDPSTPWQRCGIYAAGKIHQVRFKTLGPVLWKSGAGDHPMRLIVLAPMSYRAHGHTLYRQPAYLLVSDPSLSVSRALQAYFYRWEIEADQKEEKDLLGIGQAQVWSDQSVLRQPAFHVAAYSALLLAAIEAYGLNRTGASGPLPRWRKSKPPMRLSAGMLIARLRHELDLCEASHDNKRPGRPWKKDKQFQADLVEQQIGMKIPVSIRAILDCAWT